ncbi:MAG: hypothetical protein WBY71_00855 [Nitrososphaeraceae archaeon]
MTGITDKIKEKVKGAKEKVVDTAEKATDTTKKSISSSTSTTNNQESTTKDPTQEYDEKEPMSPAKIKQHEPTAVSRDPNDQKIVESGQQGISADEDAKEKARRSGMAKGTAGAD